MPQKNDLAHQLAELHELGSGPTTADLTKRLRQVLISRSNHLVIVAAGIIADHQLALLSDELVTAFHRFLIDPIKRDPGCDAKIALVDSLRKLDVSVEEVYVTAIHHRQLEPVYNGFEDTAAKLRANAALALVQMNHPDLMVELADLLADSELDARLGAVQAIGYAGHEASVPLLRFKVRIGDTEPEVIYECFRALLRLEPRPSLSLIAAQIQDENPAMAELASLALGESALPEAFPVLQDCYRRIEEYAVIKAILIAMALLRYEPALDFLVELVKEAPLHQAKASLNALETVRYDQEMWSRIEEIVTRRGDDTLVKLIAA